MDDDVFKGGALAAAGSIEAAAGDALDRPDLQIDGAAKQLKGRAERTIGKLKDSASDAGQQVSAAAARLKVQAKDTYSRAADRAGRVKAQVDPFVHERPYAAIGFGMAVGLLAGLLLAGRGPKIIYVKPPRL